MATNTRIIKGKYFSVSPVALLCKPEIFFHNKRTICEIINPKIENYLYLEVGATLVGSIVQTYRSDSLVKKGDEKGYFRFGGSTVIIIFKKGRIVFDKDLVENTNNNLETAISMGESIGKIQ